MKIAGRIRVMRLSISPPLTHLVTFLARGENGGGIPHRQCWGLRALDTILKQLTVGDDELAAVHADLDRKGQSLTIQTVVVPEGTLKRLGLRL